MQIKQRLKEYLQRLYDHTKLHIECATVVLAALFTAGIWYALSCNGLQSATMASIGRCHNVLYSVIASISGSLLGFSLAAVSIIIAVFDKVDMSETQTKPEPIIEGMSKPGEEDEIPNPYIEAANRRKSKLQVLKGSVHYHKIYSAFMFSAKILAITTIVSILGLLSNVNTLTGQLVVYLLSFLVLLSAFNILWCIKILDVIVRFSLGQKYRT